ncbi:MAG: PAS domain-containing protein, partial [Candidatus Eisenbacteria bacterium]|nr:PAS domain-containing protein [Candidatus Eisenbacteria bacterium]
METRRSAARRPARRARPGRAAGAARGRAGRAGAAAKAARPEALFRELVESSPELLLAADARGCILHANPAVQAALGVPVEALLGRPYMEIFSLPAAGLRQAGARIAWGGSWRGEAIALRGDGSPLPVALTLNARRDGPGERGMLISARSIAGRKHIEEALRVHRDLGLILGTTHDLREAFERLLDTALLMPGIDCGGIYLVDRPSGALRL